MKFNYQARKKEGEIQMGVVEASSRKIALSLLQKQGLYVTYLEEAKAPLYAKRIELFTKITLRDVVLFSRQLSMMFGAKISLVEALRVLAGQTENLNFRDKILKLSEEVEGGSPFSRALSHYPEIFSIFYTSMIRAGEASGKMAESLNYLADHLEREYHLSSKTRGALIYPSLVFSMIFLVFFLMIYTVIPQLKIVIEESGVEVPRITQSVILASAFLKKYGFLLISGFFVFLFLLFRYYKTEAGKDLIDKYLLRLPIFGHFLKTIYLSRLAESLSTLISGGLMITQALDLSADIVGNSAYRKAILSARDEVRKGVPLSSVFALFPEIFSPVFIQMSLVGEKTGTLDDTLMSIASFYQKEAERGIDNILSILEPTLIIILGLGAGGLMFSILMPLYQLLSI
ncbi:MAG: type II secretion system F family protein [Patescibacteria group bacterium]|nr:type II secretion system F family protein [Patescibacteria group bacterium]